MFSPFFNPNFSFRLQNHINSNYQPNHQSFETFHNENHQVLESPCLFQNVQIPSQSVLNGQQQTNNEEECCEYRRQSTFFDRPLFDSADLQNHIRKTVEKSEQSYSFCCKQNPEKNEICSGIQQKMGFQKVEKSQFIETQNLVETCQQTIQNHSQYEDPLDALIKESNLAERQGMTQTQKMFKMFDQSELQSKRDKTKNVQKMELDTHQNLNYISQSITQHLEKVRRAQSQNKSFLKQIQKKIKNSMNQNQLPIQTNRFSLKQFHQTLKKKKAQTSKPDKLQNQQIYHAILQLANFKKEKQTKEQTKQMQNLVERLKLSILPHFQKLQSDYTNKIDQMNHLIEGMILLNVNKSKSIQKESSPKFNKRDISVNKINQSYQSEININLNEEQEECSSSPKFHILKDEQTLEKNIQQIIDDNVKEVEALQAPIIQRTDSSQGLFISVHSKMSDFDILASINSKTQPKQTPSS